MQTCAPSWATIVPNVAPLFQNYVRIASYSALACVCESTVGGVQQLISKPIPQSVETQKTAKNKLIVIRFQTVVGRIFASENPSHKNRFTKPCNGVAHQWSHTPSPAMQCWSEKQYFHLRYFCRTNAPLQSRSKKTRKFNIETGGRGCDIYFSMHVVSTCEISADTNSLFYFNVLCSSCNLKDSKMNQTVFSGLPAGRHPMNRCALGKLCACKVLLLL